MKLKIKNRLVYIVCIIAFIIAMTIVFNERLINIGNIGPNIVSAAVIHNETAYTENSEDDQRVIILFKKNADKSAVLQTQGEVNQEYKNIPAMAISLSEEEIDRLRDNPNVIAVEPDIIVKTQTQSQDWGVVKINATTAWNSNYTGRGIKVAVIDTGIAKHPDIEIAGGISVVDYTTSYADDNGHGTHVAGIIGAKNNDIGTVGVANEASIYAVKALDSQGNGYVSDVVSAIDWSITNKMDIINVSFGTEIVNSSLQSIVDKAYSAGILIVAASGNVGNAEGTGDNVSYPAKYDSVIAVTAIDSFNNRAFFSSTGPAIEMSAPGVYITSSYLNDSYEIFSGTSMATPFVSGYLAILKQAYPNIPIAQLRSIMQENAVDLGTASRDNSYGFGMVQVQEFTPIYKVDYNTQEGSLKSSTFVYQNATITVSTEPIKAGYTFEGWYKEVSCITPWKFDLDVVNGDIILYAKWSINNYNVMFDGQYGSNIEKITANYKSKLKTPKILTRTGYTFSGWYKEADLITEWNFLTDAVVGDTTLYAKWVSNPIIPITINAVSAGYNSIKLNWGSVKGASGYRIYRATTSTGKYVLVKDTTLTTWTNGSLFTGKKYYYKVREYYLEGSKKVFGNYSSSISAKPVLSTPKNFTADKYSSGRIKLSWTAVSGVSGYQIYRATSLNSSYSKVKTTSSQSWINEGLKGGVIYYYKVRSYRLVESVKVYGAFTVVRWAFN